MCDVDGWVDTNACKPSNVLTEGVRWQDQLYIKVRDSEVLWEKWRAMMREVGLSPSEDVSRQVMWQVLKPYLATKAEQVLKNGNVNVSDQKALRKSLQEYGIHGRGGEKHEAFGQDTVYTVVCRAPAKPFTVSYKVVGRVTVAEVAFVIAGTAVVVSGLDDVPEMCRRARVGDRVVGVNGTRFTAGDETKVRKALEDAFGADGAEVTVELVRRREVVKASVEAEAAAQAAKAKEKARLKKAEKAVEGAVVKKRAREKQKGTSAAAAPAADEDEVEEEEERVRDPGKRRPTKPAKLLGFVISASKKRTRSRGADGGAVVEKVRVVSGEAGHGTLAAVGTTEDDVVPSV